MDATTKKEGFVTESAHRATDNSRPLKVFSTVALVVSYRLQRLFRDLYAAYAAGYVHSRVRRIVRHPEPSCENLPAMQIGSGFSHPGSARALNGTFAGRNQSDLR